MAYTNSPLVTVTVLSPNQSGKRKYPLTRITIHCVVGQCTAKSLGGWFAQKSTKASSNYGVGLDGSIGMYVPESDRSWCSSSSDNDNRAITIEVASDTKEPYAVKPLAYDALLNLVEDICRRNGKRKLTWIPDKEKALAYTPAADEMLLTVHRWFAPKSCPGTYLYDLHPYIAKEVTDRLIKGSASPATEDPKAENPQTDTDLAAGTKLTLNGVKIYKSSAVATDSGTRTGTFYVWSKDVAKGRIRITNKTSNVGVNGQVTGWISVDDAKAAAKPQAPAETSPATFTPYLVRIIASILNVRRGPGTTYAITTQIRRNGVFTIVAEENGWGKLKSGAGWIYLGYTERYPA